MAALAQIFASVLLLLYIVIAKSTSTEEPTKNNSDLETAEANGKLDIIKQIKKVNDDGSYTIGYEADDGSFKIESRDVLGNIKGTYGYIDDQGDIKRVSYSTSNTTDIITTTAEPQSVVQRIPKINKTTIFTTRKPYSFATSTQSTPTATLVHVTPSRKVLSGETKKYSQFIKDGFKSTTTPSTVYFETSTPVRLLAQSKPLLRSTTSTQNPSPKSEGQLLRPEVTARPTDLYSRVQTVQSTLLDSDIRPVTEDPEVRGNLLRRQLPPQDKGFDVRQHIINSQQADMVDVYSGTTGQPRPLFTTIRSRIPTTLAPLIHRPSSTVRYPQVYPRPVTAEYSRETSTEATATSTPVPLAQIPPNDERAQRQQFVELRHPFHRGAVLVPVNHPQEYQHEQQQLYVRRVPKLRPIPVQVDENGYVRELSNPPTPVTPPYLSQADIINEVDSIRPPVSTRDFQKLLQQLIMRQNRLEKISTLVQQPQQVHQKQFNPYHHPQGYQNPQAYEPPQPYQNPQGYQNPQAYQNHPDYQNPQAHRNPQPYPNPQAYQNQQPYQNPNDFQNPQVLRKPSQYLPQTQHPRPLFIQPQDDPYNQYRYPHSKRMARYHEQDEEYLPAPVREMLLLRMLQLAINPSLPVEVSDSLESATTPVPRKEAVRNVEILGEEEDSSRIRSKRFKEGDFYE